MGLSKSDILKADDLEKEVVEIPEWGGSVTVSAMTARGRDAFEAFVLDNDKTNTRARLAALSVVDDKGERLFSDKDVEDLGKKSAAALDRIWKVALRLNGMGDAEELEKN